MLPKKSFSNSNSYRNKLHGHESQSQESAQSRDWDRGQGARDLYLDLELVLLAHPAMLHSHDDPKYEQEVIGTNAPSRNSVGTQRSKALRPSQRRILSKWPNENSSIVPTQDYDQSHQADGQHV
ncbi:hypothetical protein ACJRO7_005100 [Eucalyptus globulus]|uniref:Uncharacterized protein n=1 Tax=Eucalyptus globulus TaxID=34317 RepID=A0ABD3J293_EUCGL